MRTQRAKRRPAKASVAKPKRSGLDRFRTFLESGSLAANSYVVLLGLDTFDSQQLLQSVEEGLPYSAFERLVANTSLPSEDTLVLVNIPQRTLTRRKREGRFHQDESDRLVRASRIFARALGLFEGDRDAAKHWLSEPQKALGGEVPLILARTEVGALEIERLIGRLEHGVFTQLRKAWRIVKERYAASAFDGEGARLFGGRWSSPGVPVVYVASTRSLAVLEMAVHLDRSTLLASFLLIPCEFDERLVTTVDRASLPAERRRNPPPRELAAIGDAWVKRGQSAVLAVPSAIIEQEANFLLNPEHPEFSLIRIGDPEDFEFDARLIK